MGCGVSKDSQEAQTPASLLSLKSTLDDLKGPPPGMGTSASRSPQHPSGPSLTKDRAARAAAPSPLPALADGVSSPTQAQPPRRSSKPRGYRASAPDGDSIAMVTATNSSTGGAGVPQQRNYSPMVDGRPTPSAASVSYHPGAPEAKRFLGIFGRKGPSPANGSLDPLAIRRSAMPSVSGPSYSLGSNIELNHPRRRVSIVESIRNGLGMTPPLIQIPADIAEEVISPEGTSTRRGSAPDSVTSSKVRSATSKRMRGLEPSISRKVHFKANRANDAEHPSPHSVQQSHSHSQSGAHSGRQSQDGFYLSDTTDLDAGTPQGGAMSSGMGTLTGWQMLAAEVMKEIGDNGTKPDGARSKAAKKSARKSQEDFEADGDEGVDVGMPKRAKSENPAAKHHRAAPIQRRPGILSDDGKRPKTADEKERSFRGVLKNPSRGDLNRVSSNTKLVRFSDVQDIDRFNDSDDDGFSVSGKDLFRSLRWNVADKAPLKERYQMHELMGSGAYGKAYRAIRVLDGGEFVIKVLQVGMMSSRMKREARNEVTLLSQLDHPNIVKYYECVVEGDNMYIVMEYCEGGDLTKVLKARKGKPLTEEEIMTYFVQICIAMDYIHKKGVLHRDLKSSNLFLTKGKIVKLGDFGIARSMNNGSNLAKTMVGTPYYLSPEICQEKPYNHKSDIWSLGCVLYELTALRRAFDGKSLPALIVRIMDGHYKPLPDFCSDNMRNLVACLLMKEPDDRPAALDILSLDFVRGHLKKYAAFLRSAMFARAESLLNAALPFSRSPMPSNNHRENMHLLMEQALQEEDEAQEREELARGDTGLKSAHMSRGALVAEDSAPRLPGSLSGARRHGAQLVTALSDVYEHENFDDSTATTRTNLTYDTTSDGRSIFSHANSNKSMGSSKWDSDYSRMSGASTFKSFSEGQHTLTETVRKSLSGRRYDAVMAMSQADHESPRAPLLSADSIAAHAVGRPGEVQRDPLSLMYQGPDAANLGYVPGVVLGADEEAAAAIRSSNSGGIVSHPTIHLSSASSSMGTMNAPHSAEEGALIKMGSMKSTVNFTPIRDHNDVLATVQGSPSTPTLPRTVDRISSSTANNRPTASTIASSIEAMGTFKLPQTGIADDSPHSKGATGAEVDSESGFSFGERHETETLNTTAELRANPGDSSAGSASHLSAHLRTATGAPLLHSNSAEAGALVQPQHSASTHIEGTTSRPNSSTVRPPIPRPAPVHTSAPSGSKLPPALPLAPRKQGAPGPVATVERRVSQNGSSRDPSEIQPSMPSLAVGIAPGRGFTTSVSGKSGPYASLSVIPPSPILSPVPKPPPSRNTSDQDARRRIPLEEPSASVTVTPKTMTPAKEAYQHYLTSSSQRKLLAAAAAMDPDGSVASTPQAGIGGLHGSSVPRSAPGVGFKNILKSPSDRARPSANASRRGLPPIRPQSMHVSSDTLRDPVVPGEARSREESNISRVSSHVSRTSVVDATDQYRGMRTALTQVNDLITRPSNTYWSNRSTSQLAGRSFQQGRLSEAPSSSSKTAASLGLQSMSSSALAITSSYNTSELTSASISTAASTVGHTVSLPVPTLTPVLNLGIPSEQPSVEELQARALEIRKTAEQQVNKALLEAAMVYVKTTSVLSSNGSHDLSAVLGGNAQEEHPLQVPEMQFNFADLARILGPNGKDVAPLVLRLCMLDEQIRETRLGISSTSVSRQASGVPALLAQMEAHRQSPTIAP